MKTVAVLKMDFMIIYIDEEVVIDHEYEDEDYDDSDDDDDDNDNDDDDDDDDTGDLLSVELMDIQRMVSEAFSPPGFSSLQQKKKKLYELTDLYP